MGCSGSQPAQGATNTSENEAIVTSKEDIKSESTDQLNSGKIEEVDAVENLLQDVHATEENELNPVNKTGHGPEKSSLKRTITKRDSKGIENAWGASKVLKNIERTEHDFVPKSKRAELVDFESEYGKDGVDFASSQVDDEGDSAPGTRTSPDGTCNANYKERIDKQRNIHKKESDEAFDPSALIDIEKFKAANVPTKQTETSKIQSETSKIITDENRNEHDITTNTNGPTAAEVNPSNYNEFYDDDEKQLIASIENDFKTPSPFALPGSVL